MGRFAHNDVLDGSLLVIKERGNRIVLCLAQPTNYTEANSVYALASVAVGPDDYTLTDDEDGGRKLVVATKPGVLVQNQGVGTHTAVLDTVNSKLLYATPTSDTPVLADGSVDLSSWDIVISDPLPPEP